VVVPLAARTTQRGTSLREVLGTFHQLLADPANNVLSLKRATTVGGAGIYVPYIGAVRNGFAFSTGYQAQGSWAIGNTLASDAGTQWVSELGGISVNGNGDFQGAGVVVSPVIDLGAILTLKRIRGSFIEEYPTNVVDFNADIEPNRKVIEYRISSSAFNQNTSEGTLAYSTIEINNDVSTSNFTGQYIQLRLTFRTDGVAA